MGARATKQSKNYLAQADAEACFFPQTAVSKWKTKRLYSWAQQITSENGLHLLNNTVLCQTGPIATQK